MTEPSPDRELVCRELVELVTDYLEGALADAERARVEAHLASCRGCTAYVEQIRLTAAASGQIAADAIPDDVAERLLEAFRAARGGAGGPTAG